MRLSDYQLEQFGVKILRDGQFDLLGSFTRNHPKMLVFIKEEKYIDIFIDKIDKISSVICRSTFVEKIPDRIGVGIAEDPELAFYLLHNYLAKHEPKYHFHPQTFISPNAEIHQTAFIDQYVTVSDGCIIHPHATLLRGTILEDDVIIGPGCIIGGEGFRFLRTNANNIPITHVGGVIIKKNVEIQSNTCIDKGVYRDCTFIDQDTKIDNLVHIAHNVHIGKRCSIVASAMIGGSTIIGNDVWVGPNASISDNLKVGNGAKISIGAVVTKNVPDNNVVSGNFAIDHKKFIDFIRKIR